MEGWQKGAQAVLKFSSAGKQKYFKQFPEREAWFKQTFPQHFGSSATVATTSLKKVNKAKVQKQRLAAIRHAAAKRDQLKVSSAAVQAMGVRRREGGEGLGGGLETNRDIISHVRGGGTIGSGGLGSLFEENDIKEKDGKFEFDGKIYDTLEDAQKAKSEKELEDSDKEVTDRFIEPETIERAEKRTGITIDKDKDGISFSDLKDAFRQIKLRMDDAARGIGLPLPYDYPTPEEAAREQAARDQKKGVMRVHRGSETSMVQPNRLFDPKSLDPKTWSDPMIGYNRNPNPESLEKQMELGKGYFSGENQEVVDPRDEEEDSKGMYYEENEITKTAEEVAKRIIEEKSLQECMPMAMMIRSKSDDSDSMEKDSSSNEAADEPGEYDYEGDMAKSQLRSIGYNAKMLHDMLEDNTNLPEWVQSKITLAEDYMLTAANYMRGELKRMDEEVEQVDEVVKIAGKIVKAMIKKEPELIPTQTQVAVGTEKTAAQAAKAARADATYSATGGSVVPSVKDMDKDQFMQYYLRRREIAKEAERAAKEQQQREIMGMSMFDRRAKAGPTILPPETPPPGAMGNRVVQFNKSVHAVSKKASQNPYVQAGEDEVSAKLLQNPYAKINEQKKTNAPAGATTMNNQTSSGDVDTDDLVPRSMLPDQSVIRPGEGFGDDIKREKIKKKVNKAIEKKRNALPTDNPSENELVPQSMLPDDPAASYPPGYIVPEPVPTTVVTNETKPMKEEIESPFVNAASKFLTRTSARLVYGDKND